MQHQVAAMHRSAKSGTCLVVEDSIFDQQRMQRMLEKNFAYLNVAIAATIAEARRHLALYETTFILLDNNLPDGIGANFAVELSAHPDYSTIPVVMVSDWPSPFMFDKAQRAGVLHVVNKSDFGARYIHAALSHRPGRTMRAS